MNEFPRLIPVDEATLFGVSRCIGVVVGRNRHASPWLIGEASPHRTSAIGQASGGGVPIVSAPSGSGVQALLAEAAQRRWEENRLRTYYSDGRVGDRSRVVLLAVRHIDVLDGATRTLGYVPITGTDRQQETYNSTPSVSALTAGGAGALQHTYRLDRLSTDANAKIVESKPIRAWTAALILLQASASRDAEAVLVDDGIDAFLHYYRQHPIQPPGSTRRRRRAAHRAQGRRAPWQEG